jgi:flavin reductase (DIM6/NTAB) family NADH-FMN oxidoreductase RutF
MKVPQNPWAALFPCPVVLVSCVDANGRPNIITIAWAGIVCSNPPTLGLGIRPHRYSYRLIEESGEYVVNIPTTNMLKEVDFCGVVSGQELEKFDQAGLTPSSAEKVQPPLIRECPVNLECTLKEKITLGSHDLFLGEVLAVHVDQEFLNDKGKVDFSKLAPFVYNQGEYWSLNQRIGTYGFSKKVFRGST